MDENTTLSQIGFSLYTPDTRTLPVALKQTCGPFPKWSIPNVRSKIDRGTGKVYIADITEPFTVALVRDVKEDFPLLIRKLPPSASISTITPDFPSTGFLQR
jgi:hypothetical protein